MEQKISCVPKYTMHFVCVHACVYTYIYNSCHSSLKSTKFHFINNKGIHASVGVSKLAQFEQTLFQVFQTVAVFIMCPKIFRSKIKWIRVY